MASAFRRKMRHHQHKGLYIALKLGGAAVATAAAATSYVYLKRQNELKAQNELLAANTQQSLGFRKIRQDAEYDRQIAGRRFQGFGGSGMLKSV